MIKGIIFDLDGVLTDTSTFHYLAWKKTALEKLGYDFSEADNEAFRGVSRLACMELMERLAGTTLSPTEREAFLNLKNSYYLEHVNALKPGDINRGAVDVLKECRALGLKTALASSSRNARLVLKKTGISGLFEAVVDGNAVKRTKPDPDCFLKAARLIGCLPHECIVVEDSAAGLEAAHGAGFVCVGVGCVPLSLAKLRFAYIADMRVNEIVSSLGKPVSVIIK